MQEQWDAMSLADQDVIADPHPFLHHKRRHEPVFWDAKWDGWIITRRDDVVDVMDDYSTFSSAFQARTEDADVMAADPDFQAVSKVFSHWTVWTDPPQHDRIRKILLSRFNGGMIKRYFANVGGIKEYSRSISRELLQAGLEQDGENATIEIVEALATPLPMLIVGQLLGVPRSDNKMMLQWSDCMLDAMFGDAPDRFARARPGVEEMAAYFRDLCADRRKDPQDDVTTFLAQRTLEDEGPALSEEELLGVITHLMVAGHTTTADLIGCMMLAFHEFPDQQILLRDNPSLSAGAALEAMRYVTPVKTQPRTATRDFEMRGKQIRKGDGILPLLIAANRDPDFYPNPDQFDITRDPKSQLGFGRGIHSCVGSIIALQEVAGFLEAFFETFESFRVDVPFDNATDLDWHPLVLQRGLKRLPLRVTPATRSVEEATG